MGLDDAKVLGGGGSAGSDSWSYQLINTKHEAMSHSRISWRAEGAAGGATPREWRSSVAAQQNC